MLARPAADAVAENATGDTWRNLRHEIDRMHRVALATGDGRIAQRTATTTGQKQIFAALGIHQPSLIIDYQLPEPLDA